jgi:hypothetical protein
MSDIVRSRWRAKEVAERQLAAGLIFGRALQADVNQQAVWKIQALAGWKDLFEVRSYLTSRCGYQEEYASPNGERR